MEKSTTDRLCVQVFAKISASISHEIKNTLSIINENAGLLEDFAQMAEEGTGVAVERVRAVTKTIAKQVDRSNIIMKNLNRFAHSADSLSGARQHRRNARPDCRLDRSSGGDEKYYHNLAMSIGYCLFHVSYCVRITCLFEFADSF